MDQLKPHPLESELDRVVTDLEGDLKTMKHITDTGTSYHFCFGAEADVSVYLALPVYVPTRSDNLFRLEFTIGEVSQEDVGKILFAITLDMDLQRYCALRVIPRTKDHRTYEIILQTVCNVDLVREGFVATTILIGLELTEFYRADLLSQEENLSRKRLS